MSSILDTSRQCHVSVALPDRELLISAVQRVQDRWPDMAVRTEDDPHAVIRRFRERYRSRHWEGITVAFALRSAKVLMSLDRTGRFDFGERRYDELREFCIKETEMSTQTSFVVGMMAIYLASYNPRSRWIRHLGNALERARSQLLQGAKWAKLIDNLPQIFDATRAHAVISSRMLKMRDPWQGVRDLGLRSPHAPGLMDYVHLEYVNQLAKHRRLRTREGVETLLRWLRPDGKRGRVTGVREALEAVLEPWLRQDPPQPLKDFLRQQLVTDFGDPRMRADTWSTVREDCKMVIFRWLAGEDIRFFLDVVSAAETSHMWAPRRKFWLGLYAEGIVEAAWAAFSWQAKARAEGSHTAEGKAQHIAFATQTGRRGSNTSLLILKIGRCLVVEGSHSYKVHVFRHGSEGAPRLFEESYDCEAIRLRGEIRGVDAIPHYSGWEDRVREVIERLR